MKNRQNKETKKVSYRRKVSRLAVASISGLVVVAFSIAGYFLFSFLHSSLSRTYSAKDLYQLWANGEYRRVYEISDSLLINSPFNNAVRTMHGYSSFFLAVSEMDSQAAQKYLDASINSMRVALDRAQKDVAPQLEYMLGKAYYYKDDFSSYHYYADLTVHYLLRALEGGYQADDINEYLGLSYAALGQTKESIATFTEALQKKETDVLLLSIAEQCYKNRQFASAKLYLSRLNSQSQNEVRLLKSHQLLGQIYRNEKQYAEALKEYQTILEKNPNSADAYYEIGVIYEEQGQDAAARNEWRKARRIQPNHSGALQKLAGNR